MTDFDFDKPGLEFFELDDSPFIVDSQERKSFRLFSGNQVVFSGRARIEFLQNGHSISKEEAFRLAEINSPYSSGS